MSTQLAWAAGIIDGEGSFWIASAGQCHLQVKMTHRPTIERLREIFQAGQIYEYRAYDNPQCAWRVRSDELRDVITEVHRYLFTKKDHARIVLLHLNTRVGRGMRHTPEQKVVRDELARQLRVLNGRKV